MSIKSKVYQKCLELVDNKIEHSQKAMVEAQNSANAEGKSTAGDKYDTARAMSHIDRDMYARLLSESIQLKKILSSIDISRSPSAIESGSLVETSAGYYFISAGLGLIKLEEITVFALSPLSPIGELILDKNTGDVVEFNGKKLEILSVS